MPKPESKAPTAKPKNRWKSVVSSFSEEARHYKDLYLERDEIYGEGERPMEAQYYSSFTAAPDEIYVSYGIMYGIIYTSPQEGPALYKKVKDELAVAHDKHPKDPTGPFVNSFAERYHLCIPNDIFFDFDFDKVVAALDKIK